MMKLYGTETSPYVRKARILIKEKELPCEWVREAPGDVGARFAELNPLGKVPVLELDDGNALFDSPVIVEYLDRLQGDPLIPVEGEARWQVQKMHALADGILDAVVARLMETRRQPMHQSLDAMEKQEHKIVNALFHIEKRIDENSYLVGGKFSMADLALGVALQYIDFRYPHDWRSRTPRLAYWLAGISTRPAFPETEPPGMGRIPDSPH
jgi:glutathione S-transferase